MPTRVILTLLSKNSRNRKLLYRFVTVLLCLLSARIVPAETRGILWRFPTGGRIVGGAVTLPSGRIVFASEDRYLYAVNPEGTLVWRTDLFFRPAGGVSAGRDGTVYITGRNGVIAAYNSSGGIIWKGDMGGIPASPPLTAEDGTVITCSQGGVISGWSHNGFLRWQRSMGDEVSGHPVVSKDSVIIVPLTGGYLVALDRYGQELWRFLTAGKPTTPFPAAGGTGCGTEYGTVFLLDDRGILRWNISYTEPVRMLGRFQNLMFIRTGDSTVRCLTEEGGLIWKRGIGSISAAGHCDNALVLCGPGGIDILDYEGRLLESLRMETGPGTWSNGPGGTLLHGGENWVLTCADLSVLKQCTGNINFGYGRAGGGASPEKSNSVDYGYMIQVAEGYREEAMAEVIGEFEAMSAASPPESIPPYSEEVLRLLAAGAVTHPLYTGKKLINDFPLLRVRALGMLEKYGSLDATAFLLSLLSLEWDPFVLSRIIVTLGILGHDAGGRVLDEIYRIFTRQRNDDLRLAAAALDALEGIHVYNGEIDAETAVLLCMYVFRGNFPRDLRSRASRLLLNIE